MPENNGKWWKNPFLWILVATNLFAAGGTIATFRIEIGNLKDTIKTEQQIRREHIKEDFTQDEFDLYEKKQEGRDARQDERINKLEDRINRGK